MNKIYVQMEFSSGLFYEYSANPKEGFDKHESKTGKVSYRKYHKKGVTGEVESVKLYDKKVNETNTTPQISITLKNGEDIIYVPFNLQNSKGRIDQFAEEVIRVLPKLNKGDVVTIFPYNFIPEGSKYAKVGVSFKKGEEKIQGLSISYTDKDGNKVVGDVPAVVWKVNPLDKTKKVPSAASIEVKEEYLLEVLKEQTERLAWTGNGATTPKQEQPKAETPAPKQQAPSEEVADDLPF